MRDRSDKHKHDGESAGVMLLYLMTTAGCGALLAIPILSYVLTLMSFGMLLIWMTHLGRFTLLIMPGILIATTAWWLLRRHYGAPRDWLTPWNMLGIWLGLLFLHSGYAFALSNLENYHHGAKRPDVTFFETFLWPLQPTPSELRR